MDEIAQVVALMGHIVNDQRIIDAASNGAVRIEIGHKLVDPQDWRSIRPYLVIEPTQPRRYSTDLRRLA